MGIGEKLKRYCVERLIGLFSFKDRVNITLKSKNGNIFQGLGLIYCFFFFFSGGGGVEGGDSYSFNHTSPRHFDIKGLPAGPNNRRHLLSLSGKGYGLWAVPCLLLKVMVC